MEENKYNYCHVAGTTDVGCVRKANEDSMGSRETKNGLVVVVCDGMGGHVGGAMASSIAVETILDFLDAEYNSDPQEAIGQAIDAANAAVLARADAQPELRGMGSTCVLLLVRDGKVYIGSVGDSRIYLVRNRIAKQLTKDQSYVQMLVDMGQITEEQAETHPRKNEITNAIGLQGMKPATVLPNAIYPEAGDCFLLCSDGLSGMVPKREIGLIAGDITNMRAQERTDKLIDKAKANGGLDNVTAQIVEFSIAPNKKEGGKGGKTIKLAAIIAAILIVAGLGLWALLSSKGGDDNVLVRFKVNDIQFAENEPALTIIKTESGIDINGQAIVGKYELSVGNVGFNDKLFNCQVLPNESVKLLFRDLPVDSVELIMKGENVRIVAMVSGKKPVAGGDQGIKPNKPLQTQKKPQGGGGDQGKGNVGKGNQPGTVTQTEIPTAPQTKIEKDVAPENIIEGKFETQLEGSVLVTIVFQKVGGFCNNIRFILPEELKPLPAVVDQGFDINTFACDDTKCKFVINKHDDKINDTILIYHPTGFDGDCEFLFTIESKLQKYPYRVKIHYNHIATLDNNTEVVEGEADPNPTEVEPEGGGEPVQKADTITMLRSVQMKVGDTLIFKTSEEGFLYGSESVLTSYTKYRLLDNNKNKKLVADSIVNDSVNEYYFILKKALKGNEFVDLYIYGKYNENDKVIQFKITRQQ